MFDIFDPAQTGFLAAAAFLAGLVRGFSGFGSALVYMPLAAQVLTPFQALTTLVIFDLIGPLPLVRRAMRQCEPSDLARLIAGLAVALPVGLFVLTLLSPDVFRYTISGLALVLLACLMSGFRYRGRLTPPLVYVTGGMSGFFLGVAGLPGPPVVLFYMASTRAVEVVRANTFLFLLMTDIILLPMLAIFGRLDPSAIALGLVLILPCLLGGLIGARLFRPELERIYRTIAYVIIAASAISGLPVWS